MKKISKETNMLRLVIAIAVTMAFIMPVTAISVQENKVSNSTGAAATIYVDDDNVAGPWDGTMDHPYRYIQDGVDAAAAGDTVFIFDGYYDLTVDGFVIIDKTLTLQGESQVGVIINYDLLDFGTKMIAVEANDVTIDSMTFTTPMGSTTTHCIYVNASENCHITNIITDTGNVHGSVIWVYNSPNCMIDNCNFSTTIHTITIEGAGGSTVADVVVYNPFFPSMLPQLTAVELLSTSDNTINGVTGLNLGKGVYSSDASNNLIENCDIICWDRFGSRGIVLKGDNNRVHDCTMSRVEYGIELNGQYNNIIGCTIQDIESFGLYLKYAKYCTFIDNHISDVAFVLIKFMGGTLNTIHHNEFVNYTDAIVIADGLMTSNDWDDGFEGNYWDDWSENPGYPDTYDIAFRNTDFHPLDSWIAAPPQVTVLYPNEEEAIIGGEIEILYSDVTDVYGNALAGADIEVGFSDDGGETWELIDDGLEATGSYLWDTLADDSLIDSDDYLVRVGATIGGRTGFDASDEEFALDATDPTLEIKRPVNGSIYLGNGELFNIPFLPTIAIGEIVTIADAQDEMSGIDHVLFELSGGTTNDDVDQPYSWAIKGEGIGKQTLTVTAYDLVGRSSTQSMDILFILN